MELQEIAVNGFDAPTIRKGELSDLSGAFPNGFNYVGKWIKLEGWAEFKPVERAILGSEGVSVVVLNDQFNEVDSEELLLTPTTFFLICKPGTCFLSEDGKLTNGVDVWKTRSKETGHIERIAFTTRGWDEQNKVQSFSVNVIAPKRLEYGGIEYSQVVIENDSVFTESSVLAIKSALELASEWDKLIVHNWEKSLSK